MVGLFYRNIMLILLKQHNLIPQKDSLTESPIEVRRMLLTSTKMKLAEEVYKHLPRNKDEVIGLDVGTTTWHLAKLLTERDRRTIVTNSQEIAELYLNKPDSNLYSTGGLLRAFDNGFYGPWAVRNISSTHMTASVLSTAGVKNWNGIGGVSFEDGEIKRAYLKNSELVIAMLDSSKFSQCTLM